MPYNNDATSILQVKSAPGLPGGYMPLPLSWTGVSPLFRLFPLANIPDTETATSYRAVPWHYPGARMVNILNLNAYDDIVYGDDTWRLFPLRSKFDTLDINATGDTGVAVRISDG